MSQIAGQIRKVCRQVRDRVQARRQQHQYSRYQTDPVGYCRDVLGVKLWAVQEEIARSLLLPPYKALVKSCHKVGKSFLAAALISWHFDCFPRSLQLTTGPSKEAVEGQLWRELRIQREHAGLGGFTGAKAPELWTSADHHAAGITSSRPEAFQGRHQEHMLFVIDEGVGVQPWVYDVIRGMWKPSGHHHLLIIGNPTDTASQMYAEEHAVGLDGQPRYHLVTMSALDHPNLDAELRGEPPPYPAAVTLDQFAGWISEYGCDPVPPDEVCETDFQFPPEWWRLKRNATETPPKRHQSATETTLSPENAPLDPHWWRPGPEMEARGLGRWPTAGVKGVWSEMLWKAAVRARPWEPSLHAGLPCLGCDVARYGTNYTAIHARVAGTSLAHERHNGWSIVRTAGRLIELCNEWAAWYNGLMPLHMAPITAKQIPVNVDDSGVGGGVTDLGNAQGYFWRGVVAQSSAVQYDRYDNARSELWFATADRARQGRLDLSRLPGDALARLRQQALAPLWIQDATGRRRVEPKQDTEQRLGMLSPDCMDSLNLSYYETTATTPTVLTEPSAGIDVQERGGAHKRGWFGLGGAGR